MARDEFKRLATLLKLAELREQRAVRALGEATGRVREAQRQAAQLADYEQEYARELHTRGGAGLNTLQLINYDRFRDSLRSAGEAQNLALEQAREMRERVRQRWSEEHGRRRLLEQLRERRRARAEQRAEQRVQRELDDRYRPPAEEPEFDFVTGPGGGESGDDR